MAQGDTAFLFDLDGTLVDSVYQHVLAWKEALDEEGIELAVWRIHRRIGMSGGLFTNALLRETGVEIDRRTRRAAAASPRARRTPQRARQVRPLPGARELLALPHRARRALGDRHQRAHETAAPDLDAARRRPGEDPGGHPRPGEARQARSRPVRRRRRAPRRGDRARWSSATASGTCSPRNVVARSGRVVVRWLRPGRARAGGRVSRV